MKIAILGFSLLAAVGVAAQDATAPAPAATTEPAATAPAEKKWYDAVEMSGFVDVYYQWNDNNIQGANVDGSRAFATSNKQFGVNSVELAITKEAVKESPWGFRINFMNGQNAPYQENPYNASNQIYNMNLLQEGYVSFYFDVMNGLTVDMGKMATHIGYELIETMDNPNYTIGYIFFNTIPFIHTGARASLSINDNWGASLYLYNSAQGTGSGTAGDPSAVIDDTSVHGFSDGPEIGRAVGTQVSGTLTNQISVVWNTVYGSDLETSRQSNMDYYITQTRPELALAPRPNSFTHDYWFVNEFIVSISPMDALTIDLDWTYGENKGASSSASDGMGLLPAVNRDGRNHRSIYNTYGIWLKYTINPKFLVALRYEYIDDSRNNGALGTAGNIPQFRYDLLYLREAYGYNTNFGTQARTFTITPTYNWSDNMIIKLDLRRDWALGYQYVDPQGRPASYQNGATLGIVAKF